MDDLWTHAGWFWFGLGLVLAAAEIFLPSFFLLFAALATLAPLVLSLLGFGLTGQLAGFGLALGICLFLVRPLFVRKIQNKDKVPSRSERLMGAQGHVTQKIDPSGGPGRVLVMGEDWAASAPETIAEGTPIEIVGVDGIVLRVKASPKGRSQNQQ